MPPLRLLGVRTVWLPLPCCIWSEACGSPLRCRRCVKRGVVPAVSLSRCEAGHDPTLKLGVRAAGTSPGGGFVRCCPYSFSEASANRRPRRASFGHQAFGISRREPALDQGLCDRRIGCGARPGLRRLCLEARFDPCPKTIWLIRCVAPLPSVLRFDSDFSNEIDLAWR